MVSVNPSPRSSPGGSRGKAHGRDRGCEPSTSRAGLSRRGPRQLSWRGAHHFVRLRFLKRDALQVCGGLKEQAPSPRARQCVPVGLLPRQRLLSSVCRVVDGDSGPWNLPFLRPQSCPRGVLMTCLTQTQHARANPTDDRRGRLEQRGRLGGYRVLLLL